MGLPWDGTDINFYGMGQINMSHGQPWLWLKVTAQEREDYYHKSKNLLDQLQVSTEVRHCQKFNCTDEKHLEEIENLYAELTSALLAAASSAIKPTGKKMKVI